MLPTSALIPWNHTTLSTAIPFPLAVGVLPLSTGFYMPASITATATNPTFTLALSATTILVGPVTFTATVYKNQIATPITASITISSNNALPRIISVAGSGSDTFSALDLVQVVISQTTGTLLNIFGQTGFTFTLS